MKYSSLKSVGERNQMKTYTGKGQAQAQAQAGIAARRDIYGYLLLAHPCNLTHASKQASIKLATHDTSAIMVFHSLASLTRTRLKNWPGFISGTIGTLHLSSSHPSLCIYIYQLIIQSSSVHTYMHLLHMYVCMYVSGSCS
jgi:hypothetical protein